MKARHISQLSRSLPPIIQNQASHRALIIMAARNAAAVAFYFSEAGYNKRTNGIHVAESRADGIDFRQAVTITHLPAGTELQQFTCKGTRGRYYSIDGVCADQLGIHPEYRDKEDNTIKRKTCRFFKTQAELKVLQSTAAPVQDTWSIRGQSHPTRGGGLQFFVPRSEMNQQIVERDLSHARL